MSTEASLTTIAICQLFLSVVLIAAAAALVYAVFAFKRLVSTKIDEAMAEVRPIAEQARAIAEQAKATADTVSEKIDSIMTTAEDSATSVGDTMKSVSKRMDDAVNPQMINIAGWVGTAAKCVQILKEVSTICCPSHHAKEPAQEEGS